MSIAKVTVSGTLISDPEKRFTANNNAVTNFSIAVQNPPFGNKPATETETFVVRVACWRGLADAAEEQLRKGDVVLVEGKLMINAFQGEDGVQKKSFEIDAASIEKLSGAPQALVVAAAARQEAGVGASRGGSGNGYATSPVQRPAAQAPAQEYFGSEELLTEDDIPF